MLNTSKLSEEEKRIILEKHTERPFSWEYRNSFKDWEYNCKLCWQKLFDSTQKFDSDCGWPSFEDSIPWSIKRIPDADGNRTEIVCSNCDWHLWHVFIGEKITEKNTRYCVNSASILHNSTHSKINKQEIVLWSGCFWCTQALFCNLKWVLQTYVWYAWWAIPFPSYEQVCSWATWHIEVTKIIFDPQVISLEKILNIFFIIHDPTSIDKQWNDEWEQYRSVIFYNSQDQKSTAEKIIQKLENEKIRWDKKIVTEIRELKNFRIAEWYHQNFYTNNPSQSYCQYIINPKLKKLKDEIWELEFNP